MHHKHKHRHFWEELLECWLHILVSRCRKVKFHAEIARLTRCEKWQYTGEYMAAITAGTQGIFQFIVSASDNSNVVLSGVQFTATDPSVTIVNDPSDASGATVNVTVPASDTLTTFTLSAGATVTSDTQPVPSQVSASLDITISPASVPVTFTAQIVQK